MLFGEGERALAGYINSDDKVKFLQDYPVSSPEKKWIKKQFLRMTSLMI